MNKGTDHYDLADNAELHENAEELGAVDGCIIQRDIVDVELG